MRKVLISILVVLMLIGTGFFMVNGLAKMNIKGAKGIDEKDKQIESKINELSNVISVSYASAEAELKQASNKLIDSKTEYENQESNIDLPDAYGRALIICPGA